MDVVYDPILSKVRAENISGGTGGGGGTEYVGGNGITLAGGTITATVAAVDGGRLTLSGGTATFNPVANIVSSSGATVTLNPDTAYKVFAITQAVTLNANVPASGQWGLEGHIELFVAGTGYVVTGSNVVLANALEPDAVNNCTVRFHDGLAIISVEDHVAGYIVTVNAASGAGSLAYGLSTATNEYISVDASLNGQTLDLAGATTYAGEKHVVGNGYTETIVSGGITCANKTTFSNLSMQNVAVAGGTMTLGDVFIPSGSTVSAGDGQVRCDNVTGEGTVQLGYNKYFVYYLNAKASNITVQGFTSDNSQSGTGAIVLDYNAHAEFTSCTFTGTYAPYGGVAALLGNGCELSMNECIVSGNTGSQPIFVRGQSTLNISGGKMLGRISLQYTDNTRPVVNLDGHVQIDRLYGFNASGGIVNVSSGAIIDLTETISDVPIAPGGGIVVSGGCSVIAHNGATVSIAGGTYTQISSDGTTVPPQE